VYQADLCGKIPSPITKLEDILTSHVFSFFKYADRNIFLKNYLSNLGYEISAAEAREAEFIFWPRYEDNTEPDLVIIAGAYYFLVEAKYFSSFGGKTDKTDAQLVREIREGSQKASKYGKQFVLIAITADHVYKDYKFTDIPSEYSHCFKWTNWQKVAAFLLDKLNDEGTNTPHVRGFVFDLYQILDKRNLRDYQGPDFLLKYLPSLKTFHHIFFQAETAKYRGDFIGFIESLTSSGTIFKPGKSIFFSQGQKGFNFLINGNMLEPQSTHIFFKGGP